MVSPRSIYALATVTALAPAMNACYSELDDHLPGDDAGIGGFYGGAGGGYGGGDGEAINSCVERELDNPNIELHQRSRGTAEFILGPARMPFGAQCGDHECDVMDVARMGSLYVQDGHYVNIYNDPFQEEDRIEEGWYGWRIPAAQGIVSRTIEDCNGRERLDTILSLQFGLAANNGRVPPEMSLCHPQHPGLAFALEAGLIECNPSEFIPIMNAPYVGIQYDLSSIPRCQWQIITQYLNDVLVDREYNSTWLVSNASQGIMITPDGMRINEIVNPQGSIILLNYRYPAYTDIDLVQVGRMTMGAFMNGVDYDSDRLCQPPCEVVPDEELVAIGLPGDLCNNYEQRDGESNLEYKIRRMTLGRMQCGEGDLEPHCEPDASLDLYTLAYDNLWVNENEARQAQANSQGEYMLLPFDDTICEDGSVGDCEEFDIIGSAPAPTRRGNRFEKWGLDKLQTRYRNKIRPHGRYTVPEQITYQIGDIFRDLEELAEEAKIHPFPRRNGGPRFVNQIAGTVRISDYILRLDSVNLDYYILGELKCVANEQDPWCMINRYWSFAYEIFAVIQMGSYMSGAPWYPIEDNIDPRARMIPNEVWYHFCQQPNQNWNMMMTRLGFLGGVADGFIGEGQGGVEQGTGKRWSIDRVARNVGGWDTTARCLSLQALQRIAQGILREDQAVWTEFKPLPPEECPQPEEDPVRHAECIAASMIGQIFDGCDD